MELMEHGVGSAEPRCVEAAIRALRSFNGLNGPVIERELRQWAMEGH